MDGDPVLAVMDQTIQIIFTSECLFKIWAEGRTPFRYWNFSTNPDASWNNFDFWLVAICWLPGGAIGNVAFLRLLRLMRLLKLVGKIKELQLIVMGLANGLNSVQYILILMLLIYYLFAVLGVGSFQKNDPFHFGSLGQAMLTLFRCATLENWSQVMFINFYGCDSQYQSVLGNYMGKDGGVPFGPDGALGERSVGLGTGYGYFFLNVCWHPSSQPMLASGFFILFTVISSFVMLSLFIGAVCGGMSDAMEGFKAAERKDKKEREEKEASRQAKLAAELAEDEADGQGASAAATQQLLEMAQVQEDAALATDLGHAHALSTMLQDISKSLTEGDREDTDLEKAEAAARLVLSIKRA
jgi:voltage-gated sodium channel